jgi:predicted N-acetyltransferase YhbS
MALALEAQNQLLVMTARQDGHMVGYIVFLINSSFESRGVLLGFQNIFYVKPEFRGKLGKKLRDAAKARLVEMGVSFLMLRSGVRARGPHLKAMYAREGAIALGELYMLPLVA